MSSAAEIVKDKSGTVVSLPYSNDNQIVISDSNDSVGIKWIDSKELLKNKLFKLIPSTNNTTLNVYSQIAIFSLPGTSNSSINSIKIIARNTLGNNSFSLRITDLNSGNIIAENSFTSSTYVFNDLGSLSNLSSNDFIVQLDARGDDLVTNSVDIQEISVNYD